MRITYRPHGGNRQYWYKRWDVVPADAGVLNLNRYPGRYAEPVVAATSGRILEAGCGAGRVLLHYHRLNHNIIGMDFIPAILQKIGKADPTVPLLGGDILKLPFPDKSFEAVLAFGVYHNLEQGMDGALRETRRIIAPGGRLCASMRADNVQNRFTDWLAMRGRKDDGPKDFHKANYAIGEIKSAFSNAGFQIERIEFVENMPFLYKFSWFRHREHRKFNEHLARGQGYRLSAFGGFMQRLLISCFPSSFCNVFVVTARAA